VTLDNQITGIVGPNGCGKSNIVDAIRWVIGEHKISALRSENQGGLVFNGSRTRNASGLAEVSLTFENTRNLLPTEFTTVTITRKFYKNGESEYRLNDVACRLKDIHNLFMDTGVSTDSYAIIELGMVDDIIKDKENSRRRMLEQAAGISIYKTRKKEAKNKLDATEQDLSRIEDLLFEIGNNLRTLESQAKKAEKYYQIKNEYKVVSVELAKASLEDFNSAYKELNAQQEAETNRKVMIEADLAQEEASLEAEKLQLVHQEQLLHSMQKTFNELVANIRTLESEKSLAAQSITFLNDRQKSLAEFLGGAENQLQLLKESIANTKTQIEDETDALESLKDQLEGLRDLMEEKRVLFDERKAAVETLRREQQQWQRQQFEAEKKVAVADTSVQNLQRSIHQIQEEQQQRATQSEQLSGEKETLEADLEFKKADLEELIIRQQQTKERIFESQQQLEQIRLQLTDENRKLDSKRNEHDLLKSLVDSLEGYPESIKFLRKNAGWKNDSPILSDIFLANDEYRTAIENLLEPYLSYYVVDDMAEAFKAVQLLDHNNKGKANFFMLDQVNGINHTLHSAPAGTVPALDVVTIDEKYKQLGKYLLGNVYIAQSDEVLHNSQPENGVILIDPKGKMNRGRLTLGGGSVGLFEGKKLGRAKNLEKMAKEITGMEATTTQLRESVTQMQTQIAAYNNDLKDEPIEQAKTRINQLNNQLFSVTHRIESLGQQNESGRKRLADLEQNLHTTQHNISDTRNELDELNTKLDALQTKINEAESSFVQAEQQYNQANQQYNNQNLQFTRQQSKMEGLKQELAFRSNQLTDLQNQVTTSNQQLAETKVQLEENQAKLAEIEGKLLDFYRRKEVDEKELNIKDQEYYSLRNILGAKESELNQKRRSKEQAEQVLNGIKDKLNEMKLRLASMKERLSVEFRVNLDAILDESRTTDTPVEELNANAERLKKRLENMGEVNPTAIEAYEEMKKRYDFIVEQKDDLVNAKESLLATIEEVENTANAKFKETFEKVRENFINVFHALFTPEDHCDLKLVDPDNLADTTIEIYAQPKGKRPAAITQLSGGEKTLTSTAFLFAIYLIKPAPFCILDEVDAPLDDANVGKFTNMIRKFSDNSQFIIVTHNKQTMASVDVIYGVTMQEPGVSKLVPVDFRSLN
jgi:chromosome segregation protein